MTRKYPKFCDPTNDWAFKRIFGSEQYKAATIGFINSMLPERQICDVEFLNVEIPGFTAEGREETQKELAKKMLFKGMSVQDISDLTGMSAEGVTQP